MRYRYLGLNPQLILKDESWKNISLTVETRMNKPLVINNYGNILLQILVNDSKICSIVLTIFFRKMRGASKSF